MCVGDCDGDGRVTIDELVFLVHAATGVEASESCALVGQSSVVDIIQAINSVLHGCDRTDPCCRISYLDSAEAIGQSPRIDPNIEALAASIGDGVVAAPEDYDRLARDIYAIRSLFPEVASIRYFERYTSSMFIQFESLEMAQRAANRELVEWNCMAMHYRQGILGPRYVHAPLLWMANFFGVYEMSRLAAQYARLPGVQSASPVHYGGSGPTICAIPDDESWRYVFTDAWGDCAAGCIFHDLRFFRVDDLGAIEFDGRVEPELDRPSFERPAYPAWTLPYATCLPGAQRTSR